MDSDYWIILKSDCKHGNTWIKFRYNLVVVQNDIMSIFMRILENYW